jgi:hypothetical protein
MVYLSSANPWLGGFCIGNAVTACSAVVNVSMGPVPKYTVIAKQQCWLSLLMQGCAGCAVPLAFPTMCIQNTRPRHSSALPAYYFVSLKRGPRSSWKRKWHACFGSVWGGEKFGSVLVVSYAQKLQIMSYESAVSFSIMMPQPSMNGCNGGSFDVIQTAFARIGGFSSCFHQKNQPQPCGNTYLAILFQAISRSPG